MGEEQKVVASRLSFKMRGIKGWITRIAAEADVAIASIDRNPSVLKLDGLKSLKQKLSDKYEELQAVAFQLCDLFTEEEVKTLEGTLTEIEVKLTDKNKLIDEAIQRHETEATKGVHENDNYNTEDGFDDQEAHERKSTSFRPIAEMKPSTLNGDSNREDLHAFLDRYLAYHMASRFENCSIEIQEAFLYSCLDNELKNRCTEKMEQESTEPTE